MCTICLKYSQRPGKGVGSSGAGVAGACEPPYGAGNGAQVLRRSSQGSQLPSRHCSPATFFFFCFVSLIFFYFFLGYLYTYNVPVTYTLTHTLTNSHRHAQTRLPPSNLLSFFCSIICEFNFNQAPHELAMVVLTFDTSTWETEIEASRIQSHPFQRRNAMPS